MSPQPPARVPDRDALVRAYRRRGIRLAGPVLVGDDLAAVRDTWDWSWLADRVLGRDRLRVMFEGDRPVAVLTQPYELRGVDVARLRELDTAGFRVDVCADCSWHEPGRTLAVLHYRPADRPPPLHLPHGAR